MELKLLRSVVGILLLGSALAAESIVGQRSLRSSRKLCAEVSNDECEHESEDESLVAVRNALIAGSTGDRVARVDTSTAQCVQGVGSGGSARKRDSFKFFYAVHSSVPVDSSIIHDLESEAFEMIQPAILWCVLPIVDVGNRKLNLVGDKEKTMTDIPKDKRHLSMEEARLLGLVSFSAGPGGQPVDPVQFGEGLDPCQDSTDTECAVIESQMTILAHENDGLELVFASILDGLAAAMDNRGLLIPAEKPCSLPLCYVSKIQFLGETIEEVIDLMEQTNDGGGGGTTDVVDVSDRGDSDLEKDNLEQPETENSNGPRVLYYAAVPMAILLLFALLLAKNKQQREVKTPAQLLELDQDHVLVGTGDPPRCFHEGMYHYTRSGARYLSTNCADCAETRRIGFFTDGDLPTISEDRLYDPASPSVESFSFDEASFGSEEEDISEHRKRALVQPSSKDLGNKHSAIDVHQCTSATCRICSYRPRDVSFVASPTPSPAGKMFSSQDGLGESCIV
mmetsp:Transcript_124825/g.186495  ORF Transcript_124825/g.186495 Transcript_124825/m.186495 type:complete len:509 (+) Transcript_124825:98-1624(+)|eukprot:CAMPEP_0117029536 /NCGR_PEP_ID=MMETSP0472-20121206/21382_1 /TAXON_ID=693140 ORGANISM="Tiarina fusus, Strain LIS" /NCGR_SAMPLE_ID=MMETSP0472 /ASSEMBLY_ACC=CAM_ASM_000603 /LENGTH=508 /DNA_ID=CAMNT_0004737335 /DNA_START=95 /DNA_END=1621 /DNA_ORIENTATION=-